MMQHGQGECNRKDRIVQKKWCKRCILGIILGVIGGIGDILIALNSVDIVVSYRNNEELKYDVSMMYVAIEEGWEEAGDGIIRSDGRAILHTVKHDKMEWIRIDPVASDHPVEIEKIEICSLGKTYAVYQRDSLMNIIGITFNLEDISFDGEVVRIVPENEDPVLLLGNGFGDELFTAMQKDGMTKRIILWALIIITFILGCFSEKWISHVKWTEKKWLVISGIAIGIITGYILLADIINGGYKFTYTNILYQIKPFRSLGVATKGLGGSDMADAVFMEIMHLYDNAKINNWVRYNVFGYSALNETYILSPFMWLCYGVTSFGQLMRYLLKDVLALVGMYLLLRNMNCRKIAAWTGGVIYIFSSAMVMWGGWPHTDVSCLAPLLFFFTNRFLEEYKECHTKVIWFWSGIVFVLYLMLVAGMPVYVMYFLYLGVVYEIYNMLVINKFSWKQTGSCIIIIALAIVLAGFMSFAYTGNVFFSTQDYQEYREAIGIAENTANKEYLWDFLLPQLKLSGSAAIEYTVFSGIFVIFMIPAYFITNKEKNKTFWGCAIITLLFFVFSRYSGFVYKLIPLINTSRKTRIIILINFSISILSALLISQLMTTKIGKTKIIAASAAWILTILGVIALIWNHKNGMDFVRTAGMVICIVVALFSLMAMLIWNMKQMSAMILLMSIAFSGAIFAKSGLQMIDADAAVIPQATESIQYLQDKTGVEYRMATVGQANFIPNINSYYNINNLCGHAATNTNADIIAYLKRIDSNIYDIPTKTSLKIVENWNLLLYGSVRCLLVEEQELNNLKLEEVECKIIHFDDGEYIVELIDAQPRVYIATNVQNCKTQDDVLNNMMMSYSPNTLYTMENIEKQPTATGSGSSCHIVSEDSTLIEIDASVDGSCYLVLSDYCNDDWKVFVNGEEQQSIRCNYLFNAVYFDQAGEYTVKFVYHNAKKLTYWTITLAAWGIFLALIIAHRKVAYFIVKYSEKTGKKRA